MKLTLSEENAYYALSKLLELSEVPFNKSNLLTNLTHHPDFPSLASLGDILDDLNVSNLTTRLSISQFIDIPLPAIVHLGAGGNSFVVVQSISPDLIEYTQSNKQLVKESVESFLKKWQGITVLIEPDENSGEVDFQKHRRTEQILALRKPLLIIGSVIILMLLIMQKFPLITSADGFFYPLLLLVKASGLLICAILVSYGIDQNNSIVRSVCKINGKGGCSTILNGKEANLLPWLSWSEVGLFYFSGSLLYLLSVPVSGILFVLSCLSLPYTAWSIYYQAWVAKEWCILCLSIQILLWVDFVLQLQLDRYLAFQNDFSNIYLLGISFILVPLAWLYLKLHLQSSNRFESLNREFQKLRFDSQYLESTFLRPSVLPPLPKEMIFIELGDSSCEHTFLIVTNPTCSSCAKNHRDIQKLIDLKENVKFQIILAANPYQNEIADVVARRILCLPNHKMADALNSWFNLQNLEKWVKTLAQDEATVSHKALEASARWLYLAGIQEAPTIFLDGVEYPRIYSIVEVRRMLSRIYSKGFANQI